MDLFAEIVIAAAVCLAVFLPLNAVSRRLRSSFTMGKDVTAGIEIRAAGEAESLEHAAAAALRELTRSPFLTRITIVDEGLSPEARKIAEILVSENETITLAEALHGRD
ncbi:MAG: hypothetical protein IK136_04730 [Oscillospiraceae bacterium]|nr:hypothetical protein [Oscillospiraceae bacterium]